MHEEMFNMSTIASLAAIATSIGGGWLAIRKLSRDNEKHKKIQAAEALRGAKEADLLIKLQLESRIQELESELKSVKESIEKDMEHLKETYKTELTVLGEKIETLRDELRQQSSGIMNLLTKMIDKQ
jgi:esterase/lipase